MNTPLRKRAVNLATALTRTARRFPDRMGVSCADKVLTWRELDDAATGLGDELQRRGVRQGDSVLIHSGNHVEYVISIYAVLRIGAVLAPTNSRLAPHDVVTIAGTVRPTAVLCERSHTEHARAITEAIDIPGGVLWIGAAQSELDSVAGVAQRHDSGNADVMPGDPAWYFFTSGTSGPPKAAILTHDQLGFVITSHLCDLMPGTDERDVSLVVAPLSHGAGIHLLPQVAVGAGSVLTASPRMDVAEVWRLVESQHVTNVFTVPTILKLLVDHPAALTHDHSSLRYVVYAGAPINATDQAHARQVLGEVLVQYYGLGEVTGNITVLPPRLHGRPSPEGVATGTCGYPRTSMQVSIQDSNGGQVALGERGEICVAGPGVFAGYLDNAVANESAFRNGWFRTGDIGLLDESGFLYITGRLSDMFISGGSNIHPRDIEEKLLTHPHVAEVAVLGMPDPVWGETGVAVCVPVAGSTIGTEELRTWAAKGLASYKVPRHFYMWDQLPKSAYGKVVKREIRSLLSATVWPPE